MLVQLLLPEAAQTPNNDSNTLGLYDSIFAISDQQSGE